jgi:hypothetical protein
MTLQGESGEYLAELSSIEDRYYWVIYNSLWCYCRKYKSMAFLKKPS